MCGFVFLPSNHTAFTNIIRKLKREFVRVGLISSWRRGLASYCYCYSQTGHVFADLICHVRGRSPKRTPGVKNLDHTKLLKTSGGLGYVHKAKI